MTHACDEQKIARIREMDIGAIEIDLSECRDHKLSQLSEICHQILYDAPREWLHHPRERQAREILESRARQRAEERKEKVSRLCGLYRHRYPSKKAGMAPAKSQLLRRPWRSRKPSDRRRRCHRASRRVAGSGFADAGVTEGRDFRTRNGFATLHQRGWVDPTFANITDELATAVKETGADFNSPIKAVEAYLELPDNADS